MRTELTLAVKVDGRVIPLGVRWYLEMGHLNVTNENGATVATFTPGSWITVTLVVPEGWS